MADKYRKVEKVLPPLPPNEIRVKRNPRIGGYLKRAIEIFSGKLGEGVDSSTVVIKGVASAMDNVVSVAELVKHRFKGLYQSTEIENITIADEYEPLEEGLDHLVFKRYNTMLTVTLSKNPLDKSHHGYQDPIPVDEVAEYEDRPRGRSQSRGREAQGEGGERPRSRSMRSGRFRGSRGGNRAGGQDQQPRQNRSRQRRVTYNPPADEENYDDYPRGGNRGPRQQQQRRYQDDAYDRPPANRGNRGGQRSGNFGGQ